MQNIFVPIIFLRKGSRNEGVLCACFSLKVKKLDQFTTDFYMWYMVKNCHYQLDCLKVSYEALWEVRSLQILPFHLYLHVFLICFSKPKPFPPENTFYKKKNPFSNHTDIRLNPFYLSVDGEGWWFEHSVSWLRVYMSEGAKNVSWSWLFTLREGAVRLWHLLLNL